MQPWAVQTVVFDVSRSSKDCSLLNSFKEIMLARVSSELSPAPLPYYQVFRYPELNCSTKYVPVRHPFCLTAVMLIAAKICGMKYAGRGGTFKYR